MNNVWIVEIMYDEDTHSTRVRVCDSYDKAKAYIEDQYKRAKKACDEYDTITEMKTCHRNAYDYFSWFVNAEYTLYFISCEPVL